MIFPVTILGLAALSLAWLYRQASNEVLLLTKAAEKREEQIRRLQKDYDDCTEKFNKALSEMTPPSSEWIVGRKAAAEFLKLSVNAVRAKESNNTFPKPFFDNGSFKIWDRRDLEIVRNALISEML